MHICLNMTGGSGWMGGTIYVQNIARAIAALPEIEKVDLKFSILTNSANRELIKSIESQIDQIYIHERFVLKALKVAAERFTFLQPQIFNSFNLDFFYPTLSSKRSPYTWGGWIPDFQHCYLPELFTEEENIQRNIHNKKIADNAPAIILSSRMAQGDFNRLYPEASSRSHLMTFVSCSEACWFEPEPEQIQKNYSLPDRFFLISNQFWQHKNHALVVESLGILKQQGLYPVVVCTGKVPIDNTHTSYYYKVLSKIDELGLNSQFIILGIIPRLDQIQLMRRCLAIIQPSLFEGWSTVVEDARALGKTIILSDFPVHLEQNPDCATFFERNNAEQLALFIRDAWNSLTPGPSIDNESVARDNNLSAIMDYGRRFISLARNTVNENKG